MSLLKWAIFGLLMLPLAEIAVFVAVAVKLGFLAALALTILTSMAGIAVIRNAGQGEVAAGAHGVRRPRDQPGRARRAGFLTVLAGFLLVLPGFLTDIMGALLLLPVDPALDPCGVASRRRRAPSARPAGRRWSILPPDQWRRVPEERIGHKPSAGQD